MKNTLAVLVLLAGAGSVTGCVLPASGHVRYEGPVAEFGYTPLLFSGYVVYYADGGIPFIWLNGAQFWIPTAERHYYEAYYRQYAGQYSEWYRHHGERDRGRRYLNQTADVRHPRRTPALQPRPKPVPELEAEPEKAEPELETAPEPKPRKKPKLTKKDD